MVEKSLSMYLIRCCDRCSHVFCLRTSKSLSVGVFVCVQFDVLSKAFYFVI